MGIRFSLTDRQFSVLRGYQAPSVEGHPAEYVWQEENPAVDSRPGKREDILSELKPGITGLFGLDTDSATACRVTISEALPNVVALGSKWRNFDKIH